MKVFLVFLATLLFLNANEIKITINYGDARGIENFTTSYEDGMSALEVLDKVADISIAKGKFKFVRSINGKKSIPGKYGWFYLINGESPEKMASNYKLENISSMTWYYKVEKCR